MPGFFIVGVFAGWAFVPRMRLRLIRTKVFPMVGRYFKVGRKQLCGRVWW
jgi:hypothetical protein